MMPSKLEHNINQNANLWDNIDYNKLIIQRNPNMLNAIDEPLIEHAKGIVLEVGFGNARLAKKIEDNGCEYIGIDPVKKMIHQRQEKRCK